MTHDEYAQRIVTQLDIDQILANESLAKLEIHSMGMSAISKIQEVRSLLYDIFENSKKRIETLSNFLTSQKDLDGLKIESAVRAIVSSVRIDVNLIQALTGLHTPYIVMTGFHTWISDKFGPEVVCHCHIEIPEDRGRITPVWIQELTTSSI